MRHRRIVEEEDNFVGWDGFSKDATMIGQEHKLATQLRGHDYFRRCNSGATDCSQQCNLPHNREDKATRCTYTFTLPTSNR
jgi:hypothetical protein